MLSRCCLTAVVCLFAACSSVLADETASLPLLFRDADDVEGDTYGRIEFRANPLRDLGRAENYPPYVDAGCFVPREAGGFWMYGWTNFSDAGEFSETNPLRVIRCWTVDGQSFHDPETVFSETGQRWLGYANIVHRPADGAMFLFAWSRGSPGAAVHVYSSKDGSSWERRASPAYTDHDACFFLWSEETERFVNFQTTYQRWDKRYPDNIGGRIRRVLSLRTSADGVAWEPDLNVGFSGPYRSADELIVPDENDPRELEFYRVVVFPVQGKPAGLLSRYAPSPQIANTREGTKHGPGLGVEWFFCREGWQVRRPYRDTEALPAERPWMPRHAPLEVDRTLRFYNPHDQRVVGIRSDRVFHAYCRANGEFSTPSFKMQASGLSINVDADAYDSYVMVEIQDSAGEVIDGFEKERCVWKGTDSRNLRLEWNGQSAARLTGEVVRLRVYLRNAAVYSVRTASAAASDLGE
ncbi:MAG: hypothetical protein DWQ34_00245 [Planctomycetota bacterium]|nr:MAG: hypothetical protein DWQ34_00245 [Planctomycetota bacterium]REK23630.1 MAG: hypothetical protein DWQ41_16480 [Planctomycetota bacterium]REK31143.1 MAG: hypothetical protein DWQ45_20050 [Planctomycetota bacterium]